MTTQQIEDKVKGVLSKKFDIPLEKIELQTRLAEDLGVDSFGAVELMFELEEAFGLKIPDAEIEHVRSVNDIVAYLKGWLDKNSPDDSQKKS